MDPNSAGLVCPGCGAKDYFYACPKCNQPIRLAETLFDNKKISCPKCKEVNPWPKWAKNPLTARSFACDPSEAAFLDDPERRVVGGTILAQSGLAPLTEGGHCHLEFCRDVVNVLTREGTGPRNRLIQIPYSQVTALEVSGPGAITSTSSKGHGWLRDTVVEGGLLATGLAETVGGFLLETATELMPEKKKTTTRVETDIKFAAGSRGLELQHRDLTPRVLEVRLTPAFARIEAAKATSPPLTANPPPPPPPPPAAPSPPPPAAPPATSTTAHDSSHDPRLSKLKQLAELRSSGVLTEEEFLAEKSRILSER